MFNPSFKTIHTASTIPHKLFHFVLLGKPIVANNCKLAERIIKDTNCGLIFPSRDHRHLSESILTILNDTKKIAEMRNNGQREVFNTYGWGKTSRNLLNLYKRYPRTIEHDTSNY